MQWPGRPVIPGLYCPASRVPFRIRCGLLVRFITLMKTWPASLTMVKTQRYAATRQRLPHSIPHFEISMVRVHGDEFSFDNRSFKGL